MNRCPACNFNFNEQRNVPYVLRCGHSHCKNCVEINKNPERNVILCFTCNQESPAIDLAINKALIGIQEQVKKCPDHPACNLGELICMDCRREVCFKCTREAHRDHEVEDRNHLQVTGSDWLNSLSDTLTIVDKSLIESENLLKNKKEHLYWILDTKLDQAVAKIEAMRRENKLKIDEYVESSVLHDFYNIKQDGQDIINVKLWSKYIFERLYKWRANTDIETLIEFMADKDVKHLEAVKNWANQKEKLNESLKRELNSITLSCNVDILNHFFNISAGNTAKGDVDVDELYFKKLQDIVINACTSEEDILNIASSAPLHTKIRLLDCAKVEDLRPISHATWNFARIEEGFESIKFDMKHNLNLIVAKFSSLLYFDVKITENSYKDTNPFDILTTSLKAAERLQSLRIEIYKRKPDSSFTNFFMNLKELRSLRSLALIFKDTALPLDCHSFCSRIPDLGKLLQLENFEMKFDDCEDSTNTFSDQKLFEALTTLNIMFAKNGKLKSYSLDISNFDSKTQAQSQALEELYASLARFKGLTIIELRAPIIFYMTESLGYLEKLIDNQQNLKLLYLEIEAKENQEENFELKPIWEAIGRKKELRALLIKFKQFENFNYNISDLFTSATNLEKLEEFDLKLYKGGRNFRVQVTDEEFIKCGAFLAKAKELEIFKISLQSFITPENAKNMLSGLKELSKLKTLGIDFDTESDVKEVKKAMKVCFPKGAKFTLEVDIRQKTKKSIAKDVNGNGMENPVLVHQPSQENGDSELLDF